MLIHKRKKQEETPEQVIPETEGQTEKKVSKPHGERRFRPIFDKVSVIETGIKELKESQNKLLAEIEKLKITDKQVHEEIKPENIIPKT